jgi:hypothetical protein
MRVPAWKSRLASSSGSPSARKGFLELASLVLGVIGGIWTIVTAALVPAYHWLYPDPTAAPIIVPRWIKDEWSMGRTPTDPNIFQIHFKSVENRGTADARNVRVRMRVLYPSAYYPTGVGISSRFGLTAAFVPQQGLVVKAGDDHKDVNFEGTLWWPWPGLTPQQSGECFYVYLDIFYDAPTGSAWRTTYLMRATLDYGRGLPEDETLAGPENFRFSRRAGPALEPRLSHVSTPSDARAIAAQSPDHLLPVIEKLADGDDGMCPQSP